jgi:hypothetical protein
VEVPVRSCEFAFSPFSRSNCLVCFVVLFGRLNACSNFVLVGGPCVVHISVVIAEMLDLRNFCVRRVQVLRDMPQ